MSLDAYKLTDTDFTGNDIEGLDDDPLLTPTELKERFDSAAKDVIMPKYNELVDELLNFFYPVGTIYETVSADLDTAEKMIAHFGGTWAAWGVGRVPVGVDTTQTEFNTVEKTGGDKNLQEHEHTVRMSSDGSAVDGNIQPGTTGNTCRFQKDGIFGGSGGLSGAGYSGTSGTGTGQNLQPYETRYAWKRTA